MTKNSIYSIQKRRNLKKIISNLDYNAHCEIYNLIRKDTDKISENSNGVFINLKHLKDYTIKSIIDFVDYCNKNKEVIKEDKFKDNFKNKIENQINNNLNHDYQNYLNYEYTYLNSKNINNENFTFKNYIENLSSISTKSHKKIKLLQKDKLKLTGVKARIMKKCKNINKFNDFNKNYIESKLNSNYKLNNYKDKVIQI